MTTLPPRHGPQHGFSLIDILVGMVIGLIGMIVVFQSYQAFESQKRTTTVTNDAQESGLMALTTIEREMRLAGYGLFYNGNTICQGYRQWTSSAVVTSTNFLPAAITDGGTGSDSITLVYSSSGMGATPSQLQVNFNGKVAEVVVDNALSNTAYTVGDYILIGRASQPCTRLQVTSIRTDPQNPRVLGLKVEQNTLYPANPPLASLTTLLPSGGYNNERSTYPTVIANMGQMRRVIYEVALDTNHKGQLQSRDLTAGASAVALADGIVNMQAQYGVSTNSATQAISGWVNATSTWANPSTTDQFRVKALRIAVVARSQLREKAAVTGLDTTCSNTSGSNTNGPCAWRDTTTNPAPTIDLSGNPDWQYYRYRVYETIVPLRNVMWQQFS